MTYLDAVQLANVRTHAAELFGATATITLPTQAARDANGGTVAGAPTTVATGVACSIQPLSAREREAAARLGAVADYAIYFLNGQTISTRHVVTSGGVTYQVTGVATREGQEVARTVYVITKDAP